MTSSLVPSSSASHGITYSQNVARDVAERIDQIRGDTMRSRVGAWASVLGPLTAVGVSVAWESWGALIGIVYASLLVVPAGLVIHGYRRRAFKQAETLDRNRDVAWVSARDGLIFFSDDGIFVQKRGGFRPYGIGPRRFHEVTAGDGMLELHGVDSTSGTVYSLDVAVPEGWTDADTKRVREKLDKFRP